jgi:hypothetical protein
MTICSLSDSWWRGVAVATAAALWGVAATAAVLWGVGGRAGREGVGGQAACSFSSRFTCWLAPSNFNTGRLRVLGGEICYGTCIRNPDPDPAIQKIRISIRNPDPDPAIQNIPERTPEEEKTWLKNFGCWSVIFAKT